MSHNTTIPLRLFINALIILSITFNIPINAIKAINGGEDTKESEHKFQIAIYKKNAIESSIICGGVLLSSLYVVTAHHCLEGDLSGIRIIAGVHKFNTNDESRQVRKIKKIHSQYQSEKLNNKCKTEVTKNDLSLIEVDSPFTLNDKVEAIAIPHPSNKLDSSGNKALLMGWGNTIEMTKSYYNESCDEITKSVIEQLLERKSPEQLKKTYLYISDTPTSPIIGENIICKEDILCASNPYSSVCDGDSGSPLLVTSNNRNYLIGILSSIYATKMTKGLIGYTITRCGYGGIAEFSRISYHADWINLIINNRFSQTCENITYNNSTKALTATCPNASTSYKSVSTIENPLHCTSDIYNNNGILTCDKKVTPPLGYTYCAKEESICYFTGQKKDVAFGANGNFDYLYGISNSISCNAITFVDRAYGIPKLCFIRNAQPEIKFSSNFEEDAKQRAIENTPIISKDTIGYKTTDNKNQPELSEKPINHDTNVLITQYTGNYVWRIQGKANNPYSYVYFKGMNMNNLPIKPGLKLVYWQYNYQQHTISIDAKLSDGGFLRDRNIKDQYGVDLHPARRSPSYAYPQKPTWTCFEFDLSSQAGKNIEYLAPAYDNGNSRITGQFKGYIESLEVGYNIGCPK